jgi:hypothetical protein
MGAYEAKCLERIRIRSRTVAAVVGRRASIVGPAAGLLAWPNPGDLGGGDSIRPADRGGHVRVQSVGEAEQRARGTHTLFDRACLSVFGSERRIKRGYLGWGRFFWRNRATPTRPTFRMPSWITGALRWPTSQDAGVCALLCASDTDKPVDAGSSVCSG